MKNVVFMLVVIMVLELVWVATAGMESESLSINGDKRTAWPTGGGAAITNTVETKTENYTNALSDSSKTFVMNSGSERTFSLPSVAVTNLGVHYTFVKLGAGKLNIDAADSDYIADSGAGDTIYDSTAAETYATLSLELISSNKWVITGAHGTWVTTD